MKKNSWILVLRIIGYVLMVLLLVLVVMLFIGKLKNKPVFLFGRTAMWIRTNSMEDAIPAQSYISVARTDPDRIEVGDIIVFYSDDPTIKGALNTHRVVEIIGDHKEFVTKGDHNPVADSYTAKAENVVGVWRRNMPVMTVFGRLMATGWGILAVGFLLFFMIVAAYLPDVLKERKKAVQAAPSEEEIAARVAAEVEQLRAADAAQKQPTDQSKQ